ncbi:MAG: Uncharacterized protein F082_1154 [bacterium F082]|jgi:hypothetical protein|nr:MAG: Uncharacterized protein F082_1154 [bacterium F082]KWW28509.1 MAG: Uncharacterized protein AUK64_1648 [bacterium P201]
MDKNEVLEKLEVLGFDIEEVPDFGYIFKFEGLTLLYMPDDDEDFLRFAAPNVFDVTDENRAFVLEVVNETNLTIKYSKVCAYGEQVWVFYEYRMFGGELEDIIEHSLYLLRATVALFHRKVEGSDIEVNENYDEKGEES